MANKEQAANEKTLGNQAFKQQKYPQSIQHFTKAIALDPTDAVFYSNRSGAYINTGEYDLALEDAKKCIELKEAWPRGYQRLGTAYFYLEDIDQAIASYKKGLEHDPGNAALQEDLKAAERKKNEPNMAGGANMFNEQYLGMMIKLMSNPETKDYFQDPQFMKKAQMCMQNPQLASLLMQQDPRLKKAMDVIANDTSPTDLESLKHMFENKGPSPFKQESKPKAEPSKPQKMEVQDPGETMKNQGNAYFKKKNFAQALNCYQEAINLSPQEPLFYSNKAAAYIQMKEYERALQTIALAEDLFEKGVIKDYVKKAKVLSRKAAVYVKMQKYNEGVDYLERSLLQNHDQKVKDELVRVRKLKKDKQSKEYLNPQLGEKHCQAGKQLYNEGKYPAALKEYEEAIRRNPQVPKYHSNLGTTYVKLMQFQRARECFERTLSKDPNYPRIYPKKGDCHFFLKEYHKALEAYETGLKIDPNDEACKAGVQKTQMAIYSSGNQEERAKRGMADPEIQAILQTPEVRNALNDLQQNPQAVHQIMKNKSLAAKIEKLIQAGILKTG